MCADSYGPYGGILNFQNFGMYGGLTTVDMQRMHTLQEIGMTTLTATAAQSRLYDQFAYHSPIDIKVAKAKEYAAEVRKRKNLEPLRRNA